MALPFPARRDAARQGLGMGTTPEMRGGSWLAHAALRSMMSTMSPQDILELLRAEPFEPFEMQLSTGERFAVHRPENLLVGRTKCYFPVFENGIVGHMVHIALVHVVKIEQVNHPGRRRRPRKPK